MVHFLPEELIIVIHDDQIRLYGGTYGVRDAASLDSALHMPPAQFDGRYLHTTIFEIAAAYDFHLSQNHPFLDGNKRTAGMAMLAFLKRNGLEPVADEFDYYRVVMAVANGAMGKRELAEWLQSAVTGTPPEITVE